MFGRVGAYLGIVLLLTVALSTVAAGTGETGVETQTPGENATTYTVDVAIVTTPEHPRNGSLVREETILGERIVDRSNRILNRTDTDLRLELGEIAYLNDTDRINGRSAYRHCTDADIVLGMEGESAEPIYARGPNCSVAYPNTAPKNLNVVHSWETGHLLSGERTVTVASTFLHELFHEYGTGFPEQYEYTELGGRVDSTDGPPVVSPWNGNESVIRWDLMSDLEAGWINSVNRYVLDRYRPTEYANRAPIDPGVDVDARIVDDGQPVAGATVEVHKRPLPLGDPSPLTLSRTETTGPDGLVESIRLANRSVMYGVYGMALIEAKGPAGKRGGEWISLYRLRKAKYLDNASSVTVDVELRSIPDNRSMFAVERLDNDRYALAGSDARIGAPIVNVGNEAGTQRVALRVDRNGDRRLGPAEQVDRTAPVSLGVDESGYARLSVDTSDLSLGRHRVGVYTANDSLLTTLRVVPRVDVTPVATKAELDGGFVRVFVRGRNTDPRFGGQRVSLSVAGDDQGSWLATFVGDGIGGYTEFLLQKREVPQGETDVTIEIGNRTRTGVLERSGDNVSLSLTRTLAPVAPGGLRPTDPDGDGEYEDVDGDGQTGIGDVYAYYHNRERDAVRDNPSAFDFDGDGVAGSVADALTLYEEIR